ncbi:MAG: Gfo/Idh/MocA family oxidoreductase [Verrucomicrobiota bacterium]
MRVAVVGCGKGGEGIGAHSIGYRHAEAYKNMGYQIVGACDLNLENLQRLKKEYTVPHAHEELSVMLEEASPEIVSICTYVGSHLPILKQCINSGAKAIFMEKPLCLTKADGLEMIQLAVKNNTKVVVNHYRRYLPRFIETKKLIENGVIGAPLFYFAGIDGWDLMEWGTHWLDMFRFFSGDQEIKWVMGQAEIGEKTGYGHAMEDHALAYWEFADGSKALLDGGSGFKGEKAMRIVGTKGMIEIPDHNPACYTTAAGRTEYGKDTNIHFNENDQAWLDLLSELDEWRRGGPEPQCSLTNALKSTELYLAAYQSAVQRGRVIPPLNTSQDTFPLNTLTQ